MHRNATAGPAKSEWLYGYNWVSVALLKSHTKWGMTVLPILSELCVRQKNSGALKVLGRSKCRTKLKLAADLMTWIVGALRGLGARAKIRAVFHGAYAAAPLLRPLAQLNVTVVSRLRRNASLFDLPGAPMCGRRGRPRIYGKNKFNLAERAGQRHGWGSLTYSRRGVELTHQYTTFLAASRLTRGTIWSNIGCWHLNQWLFAMVEINQKNKPS